MERPRIPVVGGAAPRSMKEARVARKRPAAKTGAREERKLRYQIVYDHVLDLIAREGLKGGDKLPSTNELVATTGVSLISVRSALDKLEQAGKIQRHQGLGTFVARERFHSEPTRSGELLQTLAGSGDGPTLSTELLRLSVGLPSPNIARALSIEAGQPVWEVLRRRSLGAMPAILEQAVLPLSLIPALEERELAAGDSMYRFLANRYGLKDEYAEQSLEVDKPNAVEREALGLNPRDQVVRIRGVSFTASGTAFDCYQQTYRASDFIFYTAGSSNRRLLRPADIGAWVVLPLAGAAPLQEMTRPDAAPERKAKRTGRH